MAGFFDLFRRGNGNTVDVKEEIIHEMGEKRTIQESGSSDREMREISISEDKRAGSYGMLNGDIQSITEASISRSPDAITKMIDSNEIKAEQLITELKSDYNLDATFKENEEMSRDSIVGSAMELVTDDVCQVNEKYKVIVHVDSPDAGLGKFLQEFLEKNVNIEDRIWEWTYEVVKHGDFKLRRREFNTGTKEKGTTVKDVYYENVLEPYKVSRIEYMGKVLGYVDSEEDEGKPTFEKPESFVHFLNSKLPRREKVKVKVKASDGKMEEVTCNKVHGVSVMDNARYIYRIVNLLDNMLIMSRVARSTQYNVVKIEVGNASPAKTQEIISDVRRSIEGSTKMKKGRGMKTDPSPIPVNSNIYIPTREGKGDIVVDSINETVDVRSITDIDYFRNKEFATIKVPKSYMGFEEELPGSMGNNSLVKLDIRYARPVQKVQTIIRYGVEGLCDNYLAYRGRVEDIGNFDINMKLVVSAENAAKVDEFVQNMQVIDSTANMNEMYASFIDKAKLFKTMINLIGLNPSDIGNEAFLKMLSDMEKGIYKEEPMEDPNADLEGEEGLEEDGLEEEDLGAEEETGEDNTFGGSGVGEWETGKPKASDSKFGGKGGGEW